jgi:hypothetical protein
MIAMSGAYVAKMMEFHSQILEGKSIHSNVPLDSGLTSHCR